MERPSCDHSFFVGRADAHVLREIEDARLCFSLCLLRRCELADRPRSARILWAEGKSARWNVSLSGSSGDLGLALGFVLREQTYQNRILCTSVYSHRGAPATRDRRVGFTASFRWRSFSRIEMAGPRTHSHLSECFPLQTSSERRLFGHLRASLSIPLQTTACARWMGSSQHNLRRRGTGRP